MAITIMIAINGRTVAEATLVNIDNGSLSAPDYAIIATETAHPLTGAPARERRGLLVAMPSRKSLWRLVEAAARFASEETEKT